MSQLKGLSTKELEVRFARWKSDADRLRLLENVLSKRKTKIARLLLQSVRAQLRLVGSGSKRNLIRSSGSNAGSRPELRRPEEGTVGSEIQPTECIGMTAAGNKCKITLKPGDFVQRKPYCFLHKRQAPGIAVTYSIHRSRPSSTSPQLVYRDTKRQVETMNNPSTDDSVWISPEDRRAIAAAPMVESLRAKLLEGLNRGPLVDLRHSERSRSHVRIVHTDLDEAFEVLAGTTNNGPGEFASLDEPPDEPADERTDRFVIAYESARRTDPGIEALLDRLDPDEETDQRILIEAERKIKDRVREAHGMAPRMRRGVQTPAEIARSQGINPSFQLGGSVQPSGKRSGVQLQTLQYSREMAAKLNALRTGARRAMEESGATALHGVFGFLEWTPADRRDRPILSPLLMAPLEFSSADWQRQRRFIVYGQGDETFLNPALHVRLATQEQLILPELNEDELPSAYLARVEHTIQGKSGWRVRRFLTVGLFESSVINLWQDLDPEKWPDGTRPSLHQVVANLLAGSGERTETSIEEYEIDSPEIAKLLPEPVLDADSSQLSALIDVLEGKNLAIQGPPGTGKSQTIANTIAAAMRSGKTVLFVAEKMAALDVVKKRLDDIGLGDFVLELHSTKVRRASVYQSFGTRMGLAKNLKAPSDYENRLRELSDVKQRLNSYVKAINAPLGKSGRSVHDAMWRSLLLAESKLPPGLVSLIIHGALSLDSVELSEIVSSLKRYQEIRKATAQEFGTIDDHPWRFVLSELTPIEIDGLRRSISDLATAADQLSKSLGTFEWAGLRNLDDNSIEQLKAISSGLSDMPSEIDPSVSIELLSHIGDDIDLSELVRFVSQTQRILDIKQELAPRLSGLTSPPASRTIFEICEVLKEASARTVGDLESSLQAQVQATAELIRIQKTSSALLAEMDAGFKLTGENLRLLRRVVEMTSTTSRNALRMRPDTSVDSDAVKLLEDAISARSRSLDSIRELSSENIWQRGQDVREIEQHIEALVSGGFFTRFKSSTRRASDYWKSLSGSSRKIDREQMARDLQILLDVTQTDRRINSDKLLQQVGRGNLNGIETDFESLLEMVRYKLEAQSLVGMDAKATQALRSFMTQSPLDAIERFATLSQRFSESELSAIDNVSNDETVEEAIERKRESITGLEAARLQSENLGLQPGLTSNDLEKITELSTEWASADEIVESLDHLSRVLGSVNLQPDELDRISKTLRFFQKINKIESGTWPGLTHQLLNDDPQSNIFRFSSQIAGYRDSVLNYERQINAIVRTAGTANDEAGTPECFSTLEMTEKTAQRANDSGPALARWARMLSVRRQSVSSLTEEVIEAYEQSGSQYDLSALWEQVFWRSALSSQYAKSDALRLDNGMTLQDARTRLHDLDRED